MEYEQKAGIKTEEMHVGSVDRKKDCTIYSTHGNSQEHNTVFGPLAMKGPDHGPLFLRVYGIHSCLPLSPNQRYVPPMQFLPTP